MNMDAGTNPRSDASRRAFVAEQVRMRHYRKALACVYDASLRRYWEVELEASRVRAAKLAIGLTEHGVPLPVADNDEDSSRCLAQAMDMALSNGDLPAAEAVAMECMKLIDVRCDLLHNGRA